MLCIDPDRLSLIEVGACYQINAWTIVKDANDASTGLNFGANIGPKAYKSPFGGILCQDGILLSTVFF